MEDFHLFEGDPLNRLFERLGIRGHGGLRLVERWLVLFAVTCLPAALLAHFQGYGVGQPRVMNFFGDIAAWGQVFLGYPLFIAAEQIVGSKTSSAGKHFINSGVVYNEDLGTIRALHRKIASARKRLFPDLICLLLGFVFSALWLFEETHNLSDTWHAVGAPAVQSPTYAGWWAACIGIPVFNYWWLRWVWKIALWCYYLYRVSRLKLRLIASHPDKTGGLGFLSDAQKSYAIVIFAFGIGVIAPLIGQKIEVEHAGLMTFGVGGPFFGFLFGAPIFFTLPLLLFTTQLGAAKKRAVEAYQDRGTEAAMYFEEKWLHACADRDCDLLLSNYLQGMKNLNIAYEQIHAMRVVPFDVRSFTHLFGSTAGSLFPLLLKMPGLPEPVIKALELVRKLLGE